MWLAISSMSKDMELFESNLWEDKPNVHSKAA